MKNTDKQQIQKQIDKLQKKRDKSTNTFEIVRLATKIIKSEVRLNKIILIYQYLQTKGYDAPQYILGGKTLNQSGLAIYTNN